MAQNRSAGILAVDLSLSLSLSLSLFSLYLSIFSFHVQFPFSGDREACQHSVMAFALTATAAEVRRRELKQLLADKRSLINGLLQPTPLKLAALPSIPAPQTQHNPADPNCRCACCLFKQKTKGQTKKDAAHPQTCSVSRSAGSPAIDLGLPPGSMSSEKGQTQKDAAHHQSIPPPPGLERPQQEQELQLYVISLSTQEGVKRQKMMRLQPCPMYKVIPGVLPANVPPHVIDHWYYGRMGKARNRALQGAFAAHWAAWMQIAAAGDKGALVLEDDCVQYRAYPQLDKYPHDGITILGGCFKGFSSWARQRAYVSNLQFLKTIASLQPGLQPLPHEEADKPGKKRKGGSSQQASKQLAVMQWSMCVAYVVPPGFAKKLCNDVHYCKGHFLKSPDMWLASYTKHLLWPPAFEDQGTTSQCFTDNREQGTDLYCSNEMRQIAEQRGRPLPPRGAVAADVLSWQIRELTQQRNGVGMVPTLKARPRPRQQAKLAG